MERADPVRYLNLDLAWPGFATVNLERQADGSLTLARIPRLVETIGAAEARPPRPVDPLAPPPQMATTPDCACDVYVTDPFAALVALTAADQWSCQYVGPVPAAKDYGTLPLYTLRRRGAS